MYEVCDDCQQMTLAAKLSDHDESLMEFYCRNCEVSYVEPVEEPEPWENLTV